MAALAAVGGLAQATPPEFARQAFVGTDRFVGILPGTNDWILLEASENLRDWAPVASLASTNPVTEYIDTDVRSAPARYYRLRHPGTTVEAAEAKWRSQAARDHRFRLQRVRSFSQPAVTSATLTVRQGVKIVSDATSDGVASPSADPADFPGVGELLDKLREAKTTGSWRAAVAYDEVSGYPKWCAIERMANGIPAEKRTDVYRITEFTFLPSGE